MRTSHSFAIGLLALAWSAYASAQPHAQDSSRFTERVFSSQDYFEDARAALPEAERGNADAQYFLAQALAICPYTAAAQKANPRTDAAGSSDWQQVRREERQLCTKLLAHRKDFQGKNWMALALAQRHPAAQAETAARKVLQNDKDATARQALAAAVNTGEPYAVFHAVRAMADDSEASNWVWYQAACELGFDCSERNRFVHTFCVSWQQEACNGALWLPDLMVGDKAPTGQERERWMAEVKTLVQRIRAGAITAADVHG